MRPSNNTSKGRTQEMKKTTMGMVISEKRKELGLTQLGLAEKMGVTDKAVSKLERDLSYPDVTSLPRLAEVLGLSIDELMQVKQAAETDGDGKSVKDIVSLVFKTLCLAMGVAVVALSVLGQLDTRSAIIMLGIGLTCAGMVLLERK